MYNPKGLVWIFRVMLTSYQLIIIINYFVLVKAWK